MTNKALFLVACACSLAVAGCGLWHETPNTGIAAPGAWQNAETEAEAIWPENDWWQQFDSPALSAMVEDAAAHNFDLAAAVARVQQADAEAQIAGASLLPEIGLGGSAARNRTSGNSRSASALGITSRPRLSNAYSASASASYELDFWGKNRSASDAADALAEASRYDRETVALTVATSIANNYFALLGTQERLVLARNNLAAAEQLLEAIQQPGRLQSDILAWLPDESTREYYKRWSFKEPDALTLGVFGVGDGETVPAEPKLAAGG